MMNRSAIGLNQKYVRYIPAAGLLTVLTLFLPYISISEEGVSVSGIRILINVFADMSVKNAGFLTWAAAGVLLLPVILTAAASVAAWLKPSKRNVKLAVGAYIIQAVLSILILFTVTRTVNGSGQLSVRFLIRYLSTGYWGSLILGFAGLVVSMKAAKINPGYIVLVIMSIIWLFPIAWVILISFRAEPGSYTSYFWPRQLTLKNYVVLLTDTSQFHYLKWFGNTLFVAVCSCILSTFIVLSTAFTLSRIRFQGRKTFMNLLLILGMFPGFMSMIAVYYILKGMGLTQSLIALILVYAGGGALSYYIAKGFFDTIPKALDEAACIDGATKWQVFIKVTIPLSKPIIIYTVLTSFMGPWADFIFAKVIMGDNYENYTVALGLFTMLERANIDTWYTRFAAGAVLVSIPIAVLFISLQKYYVEGLSGSVKG